MNLNSMPFFENRTLKGRRYRELEAIMYNKYIKLKFRWGFGFWLDTGYRVLLNTE